MGYKEDFQKQGRALRTRNKAQVRFWEMSKHGGAHEDKGGNHAKRAIQRRQFDDDVENALKDWEDDEDFGE